MQITVQYPSGLTYTLHATWQMRKHSPTLRVVGDQRVMGDLIRDGTAWYGDPRAVYLETDTGRVLFNPRDHIEQLPRVMQDWLAQHPEWPGAIVKTATVTKNAVP